MRAVSRASSGRKRRVIVQCEDLFLSLLQSKAQQTKQISLVFGNVFSDPHFLGLPTFLGRLRISLQDTRPAPGNIEQIANLGRAYLKVMVAAPSMEKGVIPRLDAEPFE